jgi:hypothetical protein
MYEVILPHFKLHFCKLILLYFYILLTVHPEAIVGFQPT